MNRFLSSLLCVFLISPVLAQTSENYQKALIILDKAITVTSPNPPNGVLLTTSGVIYNMGHYDIPEKTRDIAVEETVGFFQKEQVVYLRSVIQNNGNSYIRSGVSKADSLYSISYYERALTQTNAQEFQFETAKVLPIKLLQFARENRRSLRYLGEVAGFYLLSFSYKPNDAVTLYIDKKTDLLNKVEKTTYNDRYGDGVLVSEYKNYQEQSGLNVPKSRVDYELGKIEREITYSTVRVDAKPDSGSLLLKWVPTAFRSKLATVAKKGETLTVEAITPTIDLVKIMSQNNKVLVVQFEDYIGLFESPAGLGLNQQIMADIQQRYPKKPIRYVFLTHHHPDHAGGIRAFTNLPVTIVTTVGNEAYFRKMLTTSHTLGETASVSGNKITFDFVPLEGQKRYKDKLTEVVAYEIGKSTGHTAEHLVYYFPQQKMIWSGDLLFFRADGRIYPAGDRGKSVYNLITSKNLSVEKIYTSWPLNGQTPFGTLDDLRKATEMK
jgi:hypothetical protein